MRPRCGGWSSLRSPATSEILTLHQIFSSCTTCMHARECLACMLERRVT